MPFLNLNKALKKNIYYFFLIFFEKTDNNGGTINKVANVERAKPPKTTTPIPLYNSDPAPGNITNGTRPNNEVSVDMKIGLIRFLVASTIAS